MKRKGEIMNVWNILLVPFLYIIPPVIVNLVLILYILKPLHRQPFSKTSGRHASTMPSMA